MPATLGRGGRRGQGQAEPVDDDRPEEDPVDDAAGVAVDEPFEPPPPEEPDPDDSEPEEEPDPEEEPEPDSPDPDDPREEPPLDDPAPEDELAARESVR